MRRQIDQRSDRDHQQANRKRGGCVEAVMLIGHGREMLCAPPQMSSEAVRVERLQVDAEQLPVASNRCLLQLLPQLQILPPDTVLQCQSSNIGPPCDLTLHMSRRRRPIRSRHVEWLGLVISEPIHPSHGNLVEKRPISARDSANPRSNDCGYMAPTISVFATGLWARSCVHEPGPGARQSVTRSP